MSSRHVKLDGGHGVTRHSYDAINVRAAVRNPAGYPGHRRRPQRSTKHSDMATSMAPGLVVAGAEGDLDVHAERGPNLGHGVPQLFIVPWRRQQEAEDQSPPQDHLFDVQDLDRESRQ